MARALNTSRRRAAAMVLLWAAFAPDARAARPTTAPVSPKDVFADVIHTIEIRMTAQRWKLLEPGAGGAALRASTQPGSNPGVALRPGPVGESFAYVKGQVEFDGQSMPDVGIRLKGNMSLSVSAASPRRPMKLDFERFVPGQKFAGLATLNLNNQALDPTQAREALAFELFREMGVPSPRTGYALVYAKVPGLYEREYLGLYTLIEEVDHKFLKRHFGDADGLLLKPQGMRGLAYLGDDWRQYEGRCRPKGEVNPALAKRIVELARLIHRADDQTFARQIGSYLDVDEFLRYVLVNAVLCNFDSFLSTGHNYYIYVNAADGRASFLPWDMNMAFGGYTWVGTAEQIADLSITHPYVDQNRLIERVLAVPEYREAYRGHVRRLIDGPFSPQRMRRRIAECEAVVRDAGSSAQQAGKSGSAATRPFTIGRLHPPALAEFVDRRVTSMRSQLRGARPGFVPGFRDPELVPQEWSGVVLPAGALISSMDADGDGRLSEQEVAVNRLFAAAHAGPGDSIDRATATAALSATMTDDLRKCATAQRWADWLFKVADVNHDAKVNADEVLAAYRRLLAGADFDFDGQMGGRELIEAFTGIGPP
jgi:spore coat protein H